MRKFEGRNENNAFRFLWWWAHLDFATKHSTKPSLAVRCSLHMLFIQLQGFAHCTIHFTVQQLPHFDGFLRLTRKWWINREWSWVAKSKHVKLGLSLIAITTILCGNQFLCRKFVSPVHPADATLCAYKLKKILWMYTETIIKRWLSAERERNVANVWKWVLMVGKCIH